MATEKVNNTGFGLVATSLIFGKGMLRGVPLVARAYVPCDVVPSRPLAPGAPHVAWRRGWVRHTGLAPRFGRLALSLDGDILLPRRTTRCRADRLAALAP